MNSLSFDVSVEGEETLLAGHGLKNLFRFSEYAHYLKLSRSQAHASQPVDSPSYVFVFPVSLFLPSSLYTLCFCSGLLKNIVYHLYFSSVCFFFWCLPRHKVSGVTAKSATCHARSKKKKDVTRSLDSAQHVTHVKNGKTNHHQRRSLSQTVCKTIPLLPGGPGRDTHGPGAMRALLLENCRQEFQSNFWNRSETKKVGNDPEVQPTMGFGEKTSKTDTWPALRFKCFPLRALFKAKYKPMKGHTLQ